MPLLHLENFMGYPTRCKFAVTQCVMQNVEHSFVTLRLPLLTHAQSIGDQHPTGKQEVELCCSPRGSSCTEVVLNGIHTFPERFNPSCHCATMATLHADCKTFFCTTTSCHFNFDPGSMSSFVNMVIGRSHHPYESQRSTHGNRLSPLAALTHLTVLVHVHKA